jgi:hypothetical protein
MKLELSDEEADALAQELHNMLQHRQGSTANG